MKRILWIVLFALVFTGCGKSSSAGKEDAKDSGVFLAEDFGQQVRLQAGTADCYDKAYADSAERLLEKQKKADDYGIDHPLFVLNPYGTTPGMIYMYLGTWKERPYISYQVKVPGTKIPEFTRNFYVSAAPDPATGSYLVEGLFAGLLEGVVNEVTVTVNNEAGDLLGRRRYSFDLRGESLPDGMEQVIRGGMSKETELTGKAGDGLFCCTMSLPDGKGNGYFFYDNEGILRARIRAGKTLEYGKLLTAGNHIFYAAGNREYVLADPCGRITARFQMEKQEIMQDYVYDPASRQILVLISADRSGPLKLYTVDPKDGEVLECMNFDTEEPLQYVEREYTGSRVTMEVIGDGDLLLSGSSSDSVFRINHLYTKPAVRWMLSSNQQAEQILSLSGKMSGYRGICYIADLTQEQEQEDGYSLAILGKTEDQAWLDSLLVNEKLHVYAQTGRFCLGSAAEILSAHTFGRHIVVGKSGEFNEYDQNGSLLLSFQFQQPTARRIHKMTMARYWF